MHPRLEVLRRLRRRMRSRKATLAKLGRAACSSLSLLTASNRCLRMWMLTADLMLAGVVVSRRRTAVRWLKDCG